MADAFDATTTDRPYQKPRTFDEGLAILKEGAGSKWDPECVAAFERILPKMPAPAAPRTPRERLLCSRSLNNSWPKYIGDEGERRLMFCGVGVT